MIQAIRMSPKTTPCAAAPATMAAGMRKTTSARTVAIERPESAATHTRVLSATSATKSETTGKADTAVETCQAPSGS